MTSARRDQCLGAILGLALGDALGAPHEGGSSGRVTADAIRRAPPRELRYTDDTEMAAGLAESLVACGGFDPDHLARTWADRAGPSRGYGPGALTVLKLIRRGTPWHEANRQVFPDGSFGNGGAMRAAPIGLRYHHDPATLTQVARKASEITHAHELGMQGGLVIARATAAAMHARSGRDLIEAIPQGDLAQAYTDRLALTRHWLDTGQAPKLAEVATRLGHSILATESAVTAIYLAARHLDDAFETLIAEVINLGGDVDTIGAMAGGIHGAAHGHERLPTAPLNALEHRDWLEQLATRLADAAKAVT